MRNADIWHDLRPADTERILDAAGIGAEAEQCKRERGKHLATLGLDMAATQKQIQRAYKRLLSKCAPNRLLLLGLPDAEVERVTALKAQLDHAFAALTDAP